jgi:glycosyltransferase involved in cell wall biosynthesis
MSYPVGIGIVTYNRKEILNDTIDRVRSFTCRPGAQLVVADDGSSDGTLAMLREKQVPVVTGVNMGIAWNKNRALFLLSQMLRCEIVILLEDDTGPTQAGWEDAWIEATQRWGHVNYSSEWMEEHILSGSGTPADPIRSRYITAQCSAYSRAALTYGGYFDPRFRGYGHEHVEHSRRLVRVGYGGTDERRNDEEIVTYLALKSDLTVTATPSFRNVEQEDRNFQLATRIMGAQGYRAPWGEDNELRQFRSETESAISGGPERFRLKYSNAGAPRGRAAWHGVFSRLLHRS